jgi:bifunctional DNA-binding transcriptional regulator/antitoxin component of YhaV-PrlF toxin-antitoxin module
MKLIGTSKTSTDNKITIIKEVAQKLKIEQGDIIAFYEGEEGNIIIKKAVLKPE